MAFGIFFQRSDTTYDDVLGERYHFPSQYLSRVQACIDDWIVYKDSEKSRYARGYFAVAKVRKVVPDPKDDSHFFAIMEPGSLLEFANHVPFRVDDLPVESGLLNDDGKISGRAQSAVRPLSAADFCAICEIGLGTDNPVLPRHPDDRDQVVDGFSEAQALFDPLTPRLRVESILSRPVRKQNFSKLVLRAYDKRCAFTGLRLINGGGRAEVQAAHIRPVEENGPDIVGNGLALSGTVHWMFDRGILSVSESHNILISRQVNDYGAVESLLIDDKKLVLPESELDFPIPKFLDWHRKNRFKH